MNDKTDRILYKATHGERISAQQALTLWKEAPLSSLGKAAHEIKRDKTGNIVYFNRNIHIEPTNICSFRCKFCSYRREAGAEDAWDHPLSRIEEIAASYKDSAITEVHIVGGVHPDHDLYYYADLIRRIKAILPRVTVKAFTAVEISHMIEKIGLDTVTGLTILKQAGMQAIPGGGAEIFDHDIREKICPEKGPAERWLSIHEEAHKIGIKTNATILYGHIESIENRIDHLERLRRLQDRTGNFDAFIPLKFRAAGNELSFAGETPVTEDMRMMAISRLYLDNFTHIKAYWPMYGKSTTELALAYGADDIDGTIDDTTRIYSMAGGMPKPAMSIQEIRRIAANAGMIAVERDTFYNPVNN